MCLYSMSESTLNSKSNLAAREYLDKEAEEYWDYGKFLRTAVLLSEALGFSRITREYI